MRAAGASPRARTAEAETTSARPGRKLDRSRDAAILDAALEVLAESGYDGMTVDAVAARAKAARATVYRRWATKADLLLSAVAQMTGSDVDVAQLPDTGTLRGDMVAAIVPQSTAEQELRIRVLTALLLLSKTNPELADMATGAGIGLWIEANRTLMQRSLDRGEFPPADIDTLAEVIPMMCLSRAVQQQPITREFSLALIDGVIIPAMRGSGDQAARGNTATAPGPERPNKNQRTS